MCKVYVRYFRIHSFRDSVPFCNISSNFSFLSKRYKATALCWCKQPTSNSFQTCLYCLYLYKLYDESFVILLANDLINTCGEISKNRFILWMVYACNVKAIMKGLEEVEKLVRNESTLHRRPRSLEMSDLEDHTSKFIAI